MFCLCVILCAACLLGAHRSQKRAPEPLELESQEGCAALWLMGTEPGSYGKVASAPNC